MIINPKITGIFGMKDVPLYSSRLIKTDVEYLTEHHPAVNVAVLLSNAGIATYQLEDGGHWLNQRQVDLFHEGLDDTNWKIRNWLRMLAVTDTCPRLGVPCDKWQLGSYTPSAAYLLLGKVIQN